MASEIRVNKINSSSGVGTITLSPTGVDISGITTVSTLKVGTGVTASEDGDIFFTGVCTATTFAGAHSGSGANLTNLPAANLSGTLPAISAANLTNVPAANITGTLPAISAANLTNIPAANVTGTLPAITAANLTNIPAANIVGVATAGFERSGGFAGGITELDSFRINSTFQGSAYHMTTNWERFDASGEGKKGTGITEDNGIFNFPSTGYWYIIFTATFYRGANSTIYGQYAHIRTTTDNGTYSERARGASGMYSESGNSRTGATISTIFKCENTSTHKVIFGVETETYTYTYGSTANNQTSVVFIKLADI